MGYPTRLCSSLLVRTHDYSSTKTTLLRGVIRPGKWRWERQCVTHDSYKLVFIFEVWGNLGVSVTSVHLVSECENFDVHRQHIWSSWPSLLHYRASPPEPFQILVSMVQSLDHGNAVMTCMHAYILNKLSAFASLSVCLSVCISVCWEQ